MPLALRAARRGTADRDAPDDRSSVTRVPKLSSSDNRPATRAARQPRLVVLGLTLVVGCAAVGAEISRGASHETSYLGLARAVAAGDTIERDDLTTFALSGAASVPMIPDTDAGEVIGRRASETLVAGSPLVAGDIAVSPAPGRNLSLVGTSLGPAQLPSGLGVGDAVLVVATGSAATSAGGSGSTQAGGGSPGNSAQRATSSASSGATASDLVLGQGTVFAVSGSGQGSPSGTLQVTVLVPSDVAPLVAYDSAAGDVSLVKVPSQPATGAPKTGASR